MNFCYINNINHVKQLDNFKIIDKIFKIILIKQNLLYLKSAEIPLFIFKFS